MTGSLSGREFLLCKALQAVRANRKQSYHAVFLLLYSSVGTRCCAALCVTRYSSYDPVCINLVQVMGLKPFRVIKEIHSLVLARLLPGSLWSLHRGVKNPPRRRDPGYVWRRAGEKIPPACRQVIWSLQWGREKQPKMTQCGAAGFEVGQRGEGGPAARRERGFLPGGKRRVMLEEQKSQTLMNYNAQPHGIMRFVLFDRFETQ